MNQLEQLPLTRGRGRPKKRGERQLFIFDLTYFNKLGKYVDSISYECSCACVPDTDLPYMDDVASRLRSLIWKGLGLPNIDGLTEGYVLIDYYDSITRLLPFRVNPKLRGS